MTHNGHKNYETWVTDMFLDGNYDGEGTYLEVRSLAAQIAQQTITVERRNVLADALKDYVTDRVMPEGGLAGDLLGAALGEVDWARLAESRLEEVEPV